MKSIAGFTLIELMVVIAIIGILSSIIFINFGGANAEGRDAKRQSDLRNLQSAVELYKQKYGRYPAMGCSPGGDGFSGENDCKEYITGYESDKPFNEFINPLPHDPKRNSNVGYAYITNTDGTVYKLVARGTVESEEVIYTNKLKSCDIRVGMSGGSLVSGSTDREVIGWCGRVYPSNDLPGSCNASREPFRNSYGVWGGFAAPAGADNAGRSLTGFVKDTTDIICK